MEVVDSLIHRKDMNQVKHKLNPSKNAAQKKAGKPAKKPAKKDPMDGPQLSGFAGLRDKKPAPAMPQPAAKFDPLGLGGGNAPAAS